MFTGIIETTGTIESVRGSADGKSFTIKAPGVAGALHPGDSVAVNGVCLTVERNDSTRFAATAVGETLARSTLGKFRAGDQVNLERAATPETALGGHIVQGHVDGVGLIKSFEKTRSDRLLTVEVPGEVYDYVVTKGSIAIDGVSLTVAELKPGRRVTITIVPYTLGHTIVDTYRPGVAVNVEADIIGKYVKEYLARIKTETSG